MPVTSQHVTGFVVGLGVAAAGFYFYKMNQKKVDAWLESQGIHIPGASASDYNSMTLEELVRQKEHLEDLIAEREYAVEQKPAAKKKPVAKKPRRGGVRAGTKARQPQAAIA
jgi:hypothetical protein